MDQAAECGCPLERSAQQTRSCMQEPSCRVRIGLGSLGQHHGRSNEPGRTKGEIGVGECARTQSRRSWASWPSSVSLSRILDAFKFVSLPSGAVSSLTLLGVGLVAGYLVLERRAKLDSIERRVTEGTQQVIGSLKGADVRVFDKTRDLYQYMIACMTSAESTIDDVTWSPADRGISQADQEAARRYVDTILKVAAKNTIRYRELMSFSEYDHSKHAHLDHVGRAERMLEADLPSYELRCYEIAEGKLLPAMLFMIIDGKEVILSSPRFGRSRETQLAIRHPEVARVFLEHFETLWNWEGVKVLKDKERADLGLLHEIAARAAAT